MLFWESLVDDQLSFFVTSTRCKPHSRIFKNVSALPRFEKVIPNNLSGFMSSTPLPGIFVDCDMCLKTSPHVPKLPRSCPCQYWYPFYDGVSRWSAWFLLQTKLPCFDGSRRTVSKQSLRWIFLSAAVNYSITEGEPSVMCSYISVKSQSQDIKESCIK